MLINLYKGAHTQTHFVISAPYWHRRTIQIKLTVPTPVWLSQKKYVYFNVILTVFFILLLYNDALIGNEIGVL